MKKETKSQGAGCILGVIIFAIDYFFVQWAIEIQLSVYLIFPIAMIIGMAGLSLIAQRD